VYFKTQIIVDGKPTVWCAQHDEVTLLPAKARSYELPSFSGGESSGIIKLLLGLQSPSPSVIRSVEGAMEWLDAHRIKNTRWESFTNKDGLKDRRIVSDPKAGDMWARFTIWILNNHLYATVTGSRRKLLKKSGTKEETDITGIQRSSGGF